MGTRSILINYNATGEKFTDEKGKPLDGTQIGEDRETILRFRDGYLDGDVFDVNGKLITVKPAVEKQGHLEYWRKNKLHRDNNLPAIISAGGSHNEYWENGVQIG